MHPLIVLNMHFVTYHQLASVRCAVQMCVCARACPLAACVSAYDSLVFVLPLTFPPVPARCSLVRFRQNNIPRLTASLSSQPTCTVCLMRTQISQIASEHQAAMPVSRGWYISACLCCRLCNGLYLPPAV